MLPPAPSRRQHLTVENHDVRRRELRLPRCPAPLLSMTQDLTGCACALPDEDRHSQYPGTWHLIMRPRTNFQIPARPHAGRQPPPRRCSQPHVALASVVGEAKRIGPGARALHPAEEVESAGNLLLVTCALVLGIGRWRARATRRDRPAPNVVL